MQPALAQQTVWTGPVNGNWSTASNWSTGQVPNASTTVDIPGGASVINANGAQAASVNIHGRAVLTVSGANIGGLGNISIMGAGPSSMTPGASLTSLNLTGASSAGNATVTLVGAGLSLYTDGLLNFRGTSTAATSVLSAANQAQIGFYNNASAGQATITNNDKGLTAFSNSASAGTAHIINNSGGLTFFSGTPTADTATLVNNVGGSVDIGLMSRSLGVGSLSGAGDVYLGSQNLTAGNLNQNDAITGVIRDGMSPSFVAFLTSGGRVLPSMTGGSLTKVGTGTLTLSEQNTYTGGTSFNGGVVQITADANLGAPTGSLGFNGGTLRTTADIAMNRVTTLNTGGGTFDTMTGTQLTQNGVIGGAGALTKSGAGTLVLNAANTYAGNTIVNAGTLTAGADNAFSANSAHTIASGAMLDLAGHNQTLQYVSNAGTVTLGGTPGTVLNVKGDYTGSGGTLVLNTALNGDDSPTDRLAVGGNTAGTTNVKVINVGGTGAPTIEGIKIVDVGGASNGNFTLQGDYLFHDRPEVVVGAYAYSLEKNGLSTPDDGDWYLRSSLNETTPTPIPTIGSGTFGPHFPLYQAGVPVYEAYPQILQALNELPTLRQRIGDRYTDKAELNFAQSPSGTAPLIEDDMSAWVRVTGKHGNFQPDASTTSAGYDLNTIGLQAGFEGELHRNEFGSLIGGFTADYGSSASHIASVFGNGRIDTNGFGFGPTLTWYGQDGSYTDGQVRLTWFDSDLSSNTTNAPLKNGNRGMGYAFSVETGKRVPYTQQWNITPQAQLSYSGVDFDSFDDAFGARVSLDHSDSLQGRLGVAIDYRDGWRDNAGKLSQVSFYAIPNFYYEFLDGARVDVSGTGIATRNDRLWTGLGLGSKCSWADGKYSVYGEVSANTSVSHFADSYTVKFDAGLRIAF